MRTARTLSLLALLLCATACLPGCREMIRETFAPPKARLVTVEPASDPRAALRGGPVRLLLVFQVTNPNPYSLALSRIAYSGHLGTVRIAEGEHPQEVLLEAQKGVVVKAPVEVLPSAFREALLKTVAKRAIDYEFNGSLGVRAPLVGVVQVPFSVSGRLDAADLLRSAGIPLY